MGVHIDAKNIGKIRKSLESCRKRVDEVNAIGLSKEHSSGVFNEELFKTLRAHVSPRAVVKVNHEHTAQTLSNLFNQLELILQLPNTFTSLVENIDHLAELPLNVLAKCYLFANTLRDEGLIMQTCSIGAAVQHDVVEWTGIKEGVVRSEQFQKFVKVSTSFFAELLLKLASNKPRCDR